MSTEVLSGPFAQTTITFKQAYDKLEAGHEVICIATGERLSRSCNQITCNIDEVISEQDFVLRYSDHGLWLECD